MGLRIIIILHSIFLVNGILSPTLFATLENSGCRYIKNYNKKDFELALQNWSILQDRRGIIYAANQGGVLEYNGVIWEGIPNLITRSLALDDSNTIFVGGENEIGFIDSGPNGSQAFVSLLHHLDKKEQNFGRVWKTHATKEGIYSRTSQYLFRWHPPSQEFKTWQSLTTGSAFAGSFVCRGQLFIRHKDIGLMRMINDKPELVPGGELFAKTGIFAMFPYNDRELVIGTQTHGLYLYDGKRMLPFPTEVDDYLKEKKLSYGIPLKSTPGHFALATLRGGLVIIDSRGRLQEIFTRDSGLQDGNVKYVFEDAQGNLWLALEKGISKIEYASPFSFYNAELSDLAGLVLSVTRYGPGHDLYAGTTWGLFTLAPNGKFHPVPGIDTECFALISTGDTLLAAANSGLFQVDIENKARLIQVIAPPTYCLERSRQIQGRIWAGAAGKLFSLYMKQDRWAEEHKFEDIPGEIRTIVEDKKGNLWLGTLTNGVIKVDFPSGPVQGKIANPLVNSYNSTHGLPDGEIRVFRAAGHVIFATQTGIYCFEEEKQRFIPDYILGKEFADGSRSMVFLVEDKNREIWFSSSFENIRAIPQPGGSYLIEKKPFRRLPQVQTNSIYPDPNGNITWFATNEGLVRFDKTVKKNYDLSFRTFIRKVELINDESLIFGGRRTNTDFSMPRIQYKNRNIRFKYAAPFYEDESSTNYQISLEGYDKHWSGWNKETIKEYTNLAPGLYTFRVRAKNVYENISQEDIFRFRILPPWYLTWWAYLIYALFLFLGFYLLIKWRSWKLVQEKLRLEKIVKDRTKEVYEKNILLEEQSEKLKEMDKVKSRFFANISHEFRTPLTLIMGPLEQVLSECRDEKQAGKINLALRNALRLLDLINQLLDLAKLESGRMKLQASRQDIIPFLKGVIGSFESTALQQELDLTFQAKDEKAFLYFDAEKLEKVICNLVANAIKFTPTGGKIIITAAKNPGKQKNYPDGSLEITISDTGIGIPKDQLNYIFDRFYQVNGTFSPAYQHKGTGIGLALVKELVILHHGEINVKSEEAKGTEFSIRLPLGKSHLKSEEILTGTQPLSLTGKINTDEILIPYSEKETNNENNKTKPGTSEKDIILVVEDNPDVRKYIREPLQINYTVLEAADGQQGIDKARETIPDLIISDIMMPNLDGFQLCGILKKDVKTSHIPIILLTAKASESSIIEGLETGADDYVTKPFNINILLTRIKNLIDLRRHLQEKIQRELILQPEEIAVSSVDRQFMKELKQTLEKNMSDPGFDVDQLTKALFMGRTTLNRKIKAITGESTQQFIQSYRLKRAAQLLEDNFGNVTEVSFEVGFTSSSYFTKCFKKKFHQLPHNFPARGGAF